MYTEKELKGMKRLSLRQAAMDVGIERSVSSTMSPDELIDKILEMQDEDEGGGKKAKSNGKKSGGKKGKGRKAKPPEPDPEEDDPEEDDEEEKSAKSSRSRKSGGKKANGKGKSRKKAKPPEPEDDEDEGELAARIDEFTAEVVQRLDAIGTAVDTLEGKVASLSKKVGKAPEIDLGAIEAKLEELGEGQEEIGELILKFLEESSGD